MKCNQCGAEIEVPVVYRERRKREVILFKAAVTESIIGMPIGTIVDVYGIVEIGTTPQFIYWHESFGHFKVGNAVYFAPAIPHEHEGSTG
jgi:hypothetical protein